MSVSERPEKDLANSYGLLHGVCFKCLVVQDWCVIQPELDRRIEQQKQEPRRHLSVTILRETGRWAAILLMALWLGLGSLIAIIVQSVSRN